MCSEVKDGIQEIYEDPFALVLRMVSPAEVKQ